MDFPVSHAGFGLDNLSTEFHTVELAACRDRMRRPIIDKTNVNRRIEISICAPGTTVPSVEDSEFQRYYVQRATEYERIYEKPERQGDLATLRQLLPEMFSGRHVLELACGTGYWTQVISISAASILATDVSEEVLNVARQKEFPGSKPTFHISDAYGLEGVTAKFTAGFGGFWWSHIPKGKLPDFLRNFHRHLAPGSIVAFLDNIYVEGSSTPIARRDEDGNTTQLRQLADGSTHEVLKNFPGDHELRAALADSQIEDFAIRRLQYYWCLSYRLTVAPAPNRA
jgi:demethylmenaquinone methyltransferase/2-methoxy-6-polyprenyl-1,4-benzoquinol methylase